MKSRHRVAKVFALLGFVLFLIPTCKSRTALRSQSSAVSDLSYEEAQRLLEGVEIQLDTIYQELLERDLQSSNSWRAPQNIGSVSEKERGLLELGESMRQSGTLGLADPPPYDAQRDAQLRDLVDKKAELQRLIEKQKKMTADKERSLAEGRCEVDGSGENTGCFCFTRWNFVNYPNNRENFCNGSGKYGKFCGFGHMFAIPSFYRTPDLLSFTVPQRAVNDNPIGFAANNVLMRFLGRQYAYRGCRELNLLEPRGHVKHIMDKLQNPDWSRPYLSEIAGSENKPGWNFVQEGTGTCPFNTSTSEGANPWARAGQCISLQGYQTTEKLFPNEPPKVRDDIMEFIPKSELNRFRAVKIDNTLRGRIVCGQDWVIKSASKDPEINYGEIVQVGSTFSFVSTPIDMVSGTPERLRAALDEAKRSLGGINDPNARWRKDCLNAAQHFNFSPFAKQHANIYNWECRGAAHWTPDDAALLPGSVAIDPIREPEVKEPYCQFYDHSYEEVRKCEINRGSNGGSECCEEVMKDHNINNVKEFCAPLKREIKFRGLNDTYHLLFCAEAEANHLRYPTDEDFKKVYDGCKEKGRLLPAPAGSEKLNPVKVALHKVIDLQRERSSKFHAWLRAAGLSEQRDCQFQRPFTEHFVPCYESFPKGVARTTKETKMSQAYTGVASDALRPVPDEKYTCYDDQSVPDECNGDVTTSCQMLSNLDPPYAAWKQIADSAESGRKGTAVWACKGKLTPCQCQRSRPIAIWR